MVIKIKKIIGLIFVMLFLINCTKVEPKCNSGLGQAFINDLIKIIPLQSSYNQGDEITILLNVPANNSYFNNLPRNILLETQSAIAGISFGSNDPFTGNFFINC